MYLSHFRESKENSYLYSQPVTTMAISLTSSLLLVGTSGGLVHSYDITSHQLLRTISTHKGLSISHLATMLKPPDLVGHVSLSLSANNTADSRDTIPARTVAAFQRMRDPKQREAHEVSMFLPPSRTVSFFCNVTTHTTNRPC